MTENLKYIKAPPGWSYTDPNPFTADGSYDSQWTAFCLLDRDDDQFFTGKSAQGPFSARFGRRVSHLKSRLADFLRYESAHGRTVILSFPQSMEFDAYVAQALSSTPGPTIVRPEDPPIIVHSTTQAAWESIRVEGELKASSQLVNKRLVSRDSGRPGAVEEYLNHEPVEYSDHIMFGEMDSYVPEIVVASYQAGAFVFDENAFYEPGVRLYFDNHRIIRDGLGIRDGLHVIKVRERLLLEPYLISAVGVRDVDPLGRLAQWTLGGFVEKANEVVRGRTA